MYTSSSQCVALSVVFQIKSSVYKQLCNFIPARDSMNTKSANTLNSYCHKLAEKFDVMKTSRITSQKLDKVNDGNDKNNRKPKWVQVNVWAFKYSVISLIKVTRQRVQTSLCLFSS